jgi:hypothetical protein
MMRDMPVPSATCCHCGQPLTAPRRYLATHCEAPACRHAATLAAQQARREAQLAVQRRRAAARSRDERPLQAPVIWLQHHETVLAAVTPAARASHAAHLADLAANPGDHPRRAVVAAYAEDTGPAPTTDGAVCGFCRGHCCRIGGARAGFVDVPLLQRWQGRHGGTLADAAAHYVAALPAEHVDGSCLYHGAQGCVLARDERAPICNGYACGALLQARGQLDAAPATGALLAARDGAEVPAAAWVHGQGKRRHTMTLAPVRPARRRRGDGGS